MNVRLREQLGRFSLFLLSVVILSICLGVLLAQLHLPGPVAKKVVIATTTVTALLCYFAAYKPGWLYNSLVETSKGEK